MSLKTNKSAVAIANQPVAGVFTDPTAAGLMPVSNISLDPSFATVETDEYTGSIHKNAPQAAGENWSLTFEINIRHPGGTAPPAAGAFLPGLILTGAKFTEAVLAAALPAAPEALSGGTPSSFTAGATLAATEGLYKGMLVHLPGMAADWKGLSAIRSYSAAKAVTLPETFGGNITGQYQLPKQLNYHRSVDETDPLPRSFTVWIDGVRYNFRDGAVTGLRIQVPTSTKDNAQLPKLSVTMTGTLDSFTDNPTPPIPTWGNVPLFKDGKQWLAGSKVGGSGFNVDLGLTTEAAPNPNEVSGSERDELTGSTTSVTVDMQAYRLAQFNNIALARGQQQHSYFAMWNGASGRPIYVFVPDARFNLNAPQLGGGTVTIGQELWVDVFDRNVTIGFGWL